MKYIKLIITVASFLAIFGGGIYAKLGFSKPQANIGNSQKEVAVEVPVQTDESSPATELKSAQSKPEPLVSSTKTKPSSASDVNSTDIKSTTDLSSSPDPVVTPLPTPNPTSVTWDFCNNLTGNQMVLPDGYYRSVDNNCYPQIIDPIPAPIVRVPDCEKNGTGYIEKNFSEKLSKHIWERDPRLNTYGDTGGNYSVQVYLYKIQSNGQSKLIAGNDWFSKLELGMGTYYVQSGKPDIYATPAKGALEQPCQTLNFVIDDIY